MSTMIERLEWVLEHRGLKGEEWAKRSGLSQRYVATAMTRARKSADFKPDHESLVKLARGARVSLRWLADGEGSPDEQAPLVVDPPPDRLALLFEAFRRGDHSPEDAAMAATVLGSARLPADRDAAVQAMANVLHAVRKIRARGESVTSDSIAWELAATTSAA